MEGAGTNDSSVTATGGQRRGPKGRWGAPRLARLASSGLALALGACSGGAGQRQGADSPSAEPSASVRRAGGGAPTDATGARPAPRLQPRPPPGELEHFADPERPRKILALAEQQRSPLEAELRALDAPGVAWGLEQVMRPLGMTDSVWHPEQAPRGSLARPHATDEKGQRVVTADWRMGASSADGGIDSSVEEMARFVRFQQTSTGCPTAGTRGRPRARRACSGLRTWPWAGGSRGPRRRRGCASSPRSPAGCATTS
jgi:beta-lactamase family protein